jgi:hypothetical protein
MKVSLLTNLAFAICLWTVAGSFHPCTAAETSASDACFLFSYFINNGEDGLHLARSNDGLKWTTLNGGKSFLTPRVGNSKLMRDPFLMLAPDGTFQMVWSDGWAGRTIGHASSKDLIHWSKQEALPVMAKEPTAQNCWAPEMAYDDEQKQFVIYWATTIPGRFPKTEKNGDNNHRMYCTTTRDFKTFAPTRLFYDDGFNVIDATMHRVANKYYLVVKDETLKPLKKNLRIAEGTSPTGPFGHASAPFTRSWVEGPSVLRVDDAFIVYYDCYTDHHYGALRTRDWKNWEDVTRLLKFPEGVRHGTALRVPKAIADNLPQ